MPFAIQRKGKVISTLEEGEEWVTVGKKILITMPDDPTYSREITVPKDDAEGLVEVWLGGA
ncbi:MULTISPECIES: hypothetical protein [unclassified Mesorhizobium]|uniref:hypothetical protein n=1 Tax=unclassified Mesorhizobium TaxID=325217 RepID=UPI000FE6067A|nr:MULTISPECIES: hypothetical protein [unclassified Mesorhizobium]RWI20600.1 MAG: hypothetical protein EOQ92_20205 [Mesorhizobium sp.]RWK45060.1 MAG: hypothetical protein EOR47_32720 [Mesorhizobium sp.]RWK88102.1 MAG: hypothetical protein EOR53_34395 [Mesorhizobium sp.]RWL00671.1 MAG: hypothetical protein EOR45_18720 [Mesorhizobium sp.]TIP56492.1 MAG: hypothetical protein E5X56_24260 [Mesorhizobium sp.]